MPGVFADRLKRETGHALPIAHDPYLRRKGIPTTLCMIPQLKSPCKQGPGLIVVSQIVSNELRLLVIIPGRKKGRNQIGAPSCYRKNTMKIYKVTAL